MRSRQVRALILGAALVAALAQASGTASAEKACADGARDCAASEYKANGFFRALGRLFGGGKRKQEAKPKHANAKPKRADAGLKRAGVDPKKFESSVGVRVSDARTQPRVADAAPAADESDSVVVLLARAREQLAALRVNDAIASLSRAASLDASSAHAYELLGVAYDMKGMPQAAHDAYARSLALAPQDADVLNNYGFFLYRRGEYREAKDVLKKAARVAPSDQRVWNNLALVQCKLGKYDDAFKSFVRAGGELKGRMNVGNQLERAGRDKEALKYYEEARRLEPTSRSVLQHLADVYHRLGMEREAEAARQALASPEKEKTQGVNGGGQ